ncbi:hypothetical protein PP707_00535 [Acetobacter pasteurianus]|nr:hypothetical protein [Acetobacter pasteurianus]
MRKPKKKKGTTQQQQKTNKISEKERDMAMFTLCSRKTIYGHKYTTKSRFHLKDGGNVLEITSLVY